MNKQQLASTIWESANQMRSKIDANDYKDFILGFIFYKYLSESEVNLMKKEGFTDEQIKKMNEKDVKYAEHVKNTLGYFISYENLFSTWLEMKNDFNVSNVRDALSAFERNIDDVYKNVYQNIFNTLQTGLSKLGDTAQSQTKSIRGLLKLIRRIPMDGKQDYDVLGFIYEYLISMFAANAGKKAGEFYTPHEVSVLMSEIVAEHLKDRKEIKIYDPTSGSGSLLINIGHSIAKYLDGDDKIAYYAQEWKENTYNLTRMNLVMRGIKPSNIFVRNGDTLEVDWPFFDEGDRDKTYRLVSVDAVVSNPPYSQKWDITDKEFDPRYKDYGVAPKGKADLAFLLHDLYHLEDDGIMTIVLPHGVLFRGGDEGKIRKNLIEKNRIDTIIGLPANIFYGTGIPTIILVLKKKRNDNDVLIIDASKGFEKVGKNNKLRACDIKKIVDAIKNRKTVPKYATLVKKKTIVKENEYNLNIARYVDSSEELEKWDIRATMFGGIPKSEVEQFSDYWNAMPGIKETLFKEVSKEYAEINVADIKKEIMTHTAAKDYIRGYSDIFNGFSEKLKKELIDDILDIQSEQEKEIVSNNIFERIDKVALTDRYKAYQILSDKWNIISADLEMIQTEGFEVINQVDPNMVLKKKDSNDDEVPEVQEGWIGHILPFELVQKELLSEDLNELIRIQNRISEINSLYNEIIESFEEEEKGSFLNDSNDAFVTKELKETVYETLKDIDDKEIVALNKYLLLSKKAEKLEYVAKCSEVHWDSMEAGSDGTYKKTTVNNRIKEIRLQYKFSPDSFEDKVVTALNLIEEESLLKKELKQKTDELHLKTKTTIENLGEDESLKLLELKWIKPLIDELYKMPIDTLRELVNKVVYLSNKYATTLADVEKNIEQAGSELSGMIDELVGGTSDMEGLLEFKKILGV